MTYRSLGLLSVFLWLSSACGTSPTPVRDAGPGDGGDPDGGSNPDSGLPPDSTACAENAPAPSSLRNGSWRALTVGNGLQGAAVPLGLDLAGDGERVLLGGRFAAVGPVEARNVALRTGDGEWLSLGEGIETVVERVAIDGDGHLWALTQDGEEAHLYEFASDSWVERAAIDGFVYDLASAHEGGVLVGGLFEGVGELRVDNIARVTSDSVTAVADEAPNGAVEAIISGDDGTCIAGAFNGIGGDDIQHSIACLGGVGWEGRNWPLEPGARLSALAFDPAGRLMVGGDFNLDYIGVGPGDPPPTDAEAYGGIAILTDTGWEAFHGGLVARHGFNAYVHSLFWDEDRLVVTGNIAAARNGLALVESADVITWDEEWHSLSGGVGASRSVGGIDDPFANGAVVAGADIVVSGSFDWVGSAAASAARVARHDDDGWHPVGSAETIDGGITVIAGLGSCALFVGGSFDRIGELAVHNVARYDFEGGFSALADGLPGPVDRMVVTVHKVAGLSEAAYTLLATVGPQVHVWQGESWSPLGTARDVAYFHAIAVGPDGSVYVAGDGESARVYRWGESGWEDWSTGLPGSVNDILADDTGVFLAGDFGAPIRRTESGYENVGNEITIITGREGGEEEMPVTLMTIFRRENGDLLVGTLFDNERPLLRLDGSEWVPLEGLPGHSLMVADIAELHGRLIVSGTFDEGEGDGEFSFLHVLEDSEFLPLPTQPSDVTADLVATHGALYVSGTFLQVGDLTATEVAAWQFDTQPVD